MVWPVTRSEREELLKSFGDFGSVVDSIYDNPTKYGIVYRNADGDTVREIEIPGFNKDNLSIEISDGKLIISGTRKNGLDVEETINNRFKMGNVEEVDAEIKDGILYLTIKSPKEKKQKIEIR